MSLGSRKIVNYFHYLLSQFYKLWWFKGVMQGLIDKFKRELEIRNFSKKTIKSYVFAVEKFLEFSENKGLNENSVKDYLKKTLKTKNPSTVSQNLSAIEFFFSRVLNQKLKIPHPKRNKPIPEVLSAEEIKKLKAKEKREREQKKRFFEKHKHKKLAKNKKSKFYLSA